MGRCGRLCRALLGGVFLITGCTVVRRAAPAPDPLVWRGEMRVAEDVTIPRGSRLVLEPGTVVRFARRDDDGDGWGDASLRIEGDLTALGTPEASVVFTSEAEPAEPAGWGEIRVDFGSFDLRYAVIEGSTRGLHAHFAKGRVEDSVFRRNVDGTRLGQSSVVVENCLFYDHPGKALNQRMSRNQVKGNRFRHNRNGIFLFDGDEGSVFEGNVFRGNEHPFRLGDFFAGVAKAPRNDWGGELPAPEDMGAGDANARVEATAAAVPQAGPRGWPSWEPSGDEEIEVGRRASSAAALLHHGIRYEADGSGNLSAVEASSGRILWKRALGAGLLRAPVPAGPSSIAAGTSAGRIYLLDAGSGIERDCWSAEEGSSLAPLDPGRTVAVEGRDGRVQLLSVRIRTEP